MYKCNSCGCSFEEPTVIRDDECGEFTACPGCKDDDYKLVYECEVCGEYFEDVTYGACSQCLEKVKNKVKAFLEQMNEGERKVFDSLNFAGEV